LTVKTDSPRILSATSVGTRRKANGIIGIIIKSGGTGTISTVGTFAVLQKCAS
jgi:hypothetical protein